MTATVTVSVTTNQASGTLYGVIVDHGNAPSNAQIKAGQQASGAPAPGHANEVVTAAGLLTLAPMAGLTEGGDYDVEVIHTNGAGADSNILIQRFTAASGGVSVPILSAATSSALTAASVTPRVTTTGSNGFIYAVVVPNGDSPSVAQIISGKQSSGAAAIASGTVAVVAPGVQNLTALVGLTGGTAYTLKYVHRDSGLHDSNIATYNFTTTAVVIPTLVSGPTYTWDGTFIHIFAVTDIPTDMGVRHGADGGGPGTYGSLYQDPILKTNHENLLGVSQGVNPGDVMHYTFECNSAGGGAMAAPGDFTFSATGALLTTQHDTTIRANSVLTPNPPSDGSPNWAQGAGTGSADLWGINSNAIINVTDTDGAQLLRNFGGPNQKVTFTLGPNYDRIFNDMGVILRSDGTGTTGTFLLMLVGSSNNLIILDVIAGAGNPALYNGAANTTFAIGDVFEIGIDSSDVIVVKQNTVVVAAIAVSTTILTGNYYGFRHSGDPATWSVKDIICADNP